MDVGGAAACVEAVGAVGGGVLLTRVPALGGGGDRHPGVALDGGAAGPLVGGAVLG